MWMEYPDIEELYSIDNQYLIGSDILVKPVTAAGVIESEVSFPTQNDWYDVDTMTSMPLSRTTTDSSFQILSVHSNIDKIPVYQRGGSIIARKLRLRRSTELMKNDPYTLYIALDTISKDAFGTLYMDDEHTFNHEKNEEYCEALFTASMVDDKQKVMMIENKISSHGSSITNETISSRMVERIIIMGVDKSPISIKVVRGGSEEELNFTYDVESKVLVVKKPNVSAVREWEIQISM